MTFNIPDNIKKKGFLYFKIGLTLVISYFGAGLLNQEVFIANSPKVRPNVGPYLAGRITGAVQDSTSTIARAFNFGGPNKEEKAEIASRLDKAENEDLKNSPLEAIAPGVYAKENEEVKLTVINHDEVEWVEYSFMHKGKQVKIKVQKGQQPPSPERLQSLVE